MECEGSGKTRDIFASKNLENYDGIIGRFQLKDKKQVNNKLTGKT